MQNWNQLPRTLLFTALLIGLLGGMLAPTLVNESVNAAPMALPATNVVISEFRFRGDGLGNDEFIELYNPTGSPINISGWLIKGSNNTGSPGITRATIPALPTPTILQPGQYYLVTHTGYSGPTTADLTYGTGITPDGGVALTLADGITIIDQVGLSAGSIYKEGLPQAQLTTDVDRGYERKFSGCLDDGNNSTDFVLIDPSGPQNRFSPLAPCTDFSILMTVDNNNPIVGTNVVFTITVSNGGPNDATNVTVKDSLPAGSTFVPPYTASIGSYDNTSGIWTIGSLASGASETLTITASVDRGIINIAELWNADQVDPDSIEGNGIAGEDDYDSERVIPLLPLSLADLSVTNSVNNLAPKCGTNIVFTIEVFNGGPDTTTNVTVYENLHEGLTYVSDDRSGIYTYDSGTKIGTVYWNFFGLPKNTSQKINITAKVVTNVSVTSSAVVWTPDIDSNSSNNSADAKITPDPSSCEADLSLSQTWSRSTDAAGRANLQITVANEEAISSGNSATNVQVKDLLPSGLDYVSYTSSVGTYNSTTGIWAISEIASGTNATLTITVEVAASGTSTTNFAEVWQSDQFDKNSTPGNGDMGEDDDTTNNSGVKGPDVKVADLSLTETVDSAGSNAVFTIKVSNAGPDDATGVKVKTPLAGYTHISDDGGGAFAYDTSKTYDSNDVWIWTVGALPKNSNKALTITTTPTITGSLPENWVQVADGNEVDPDSLPNNCSDSIPTCTEDDNAAAPSADLSVTKTVNNATPKIGDSVVFTITVINGGPYTATNVEVMDLLPFGLTYVSDDGLGMYDSDPDSINTGIWTVGTLTKGESRALNITATVTTSGAKTNWAEVWASDQFDPDSTPGDDSTTTDDDASAIITTTPPTPTPTAPAPANMAVLINEVAWAGTIASANDEWIELYNPGKTNINLTGWKLTTTSGSLNVTLNGTINAGGYFILERTDDTVIPAIKADYIYTGSLSDNGEVLRLQSGTKTIDTANSDSGAWPAGCISSAKANQPCTVSGNTASMERRGTTVDGQFAWSTYANPSPPPYPKPLVYDRDGNIIYGTPGQVNWGPIVTLTPTATRTKVPTPTPLRKPTSTLAPAVGRMIINEYLPRAGFDWNQDGIINVGDEFIEIKNLGPVDVALSGWELDDEADQGSAPFPIPSMTVKPGQRVVFYGSKTGILLSDGGDTVRLLNSSGKVIDAHTYSIAKEADRSWCRFPDAINNIYWMENCLSTPGTANTLIGEIPSSPGTGLEVPLCPLPDTLLPDYLLAECSTGYGGGIWRPMYWDEGGWLGQHPIYDDKSKWISFVE